MALLQGLAAIRHLDAGWAVVLFLPAVAAASAEGASGKGPVTVGLDDRLDLADAVFLVFKLGLWKERESDISVCM
jgi:hypothetical protein